MLTILPTRLMRYNRGEFFRQGKEERQARAWIDKNSSSKGSNDEHIDDRQRKLAVPLFGELDVYLDYVHFSSVLYVAFAVANLQICCAMQFRILSIFKQTYFKLVEIDESALIISLENTFKSFLNLISNNGILTFQAF